jgi:hypothetical protein
MIGNIFRNEPSGAITHTPSGTIVSSYCNIGAQMRFGQVSSNALLPPTVNLQPRALAPEQLVGRDLDAPELPVLPRLPPVQQLQDNRPVEVPLLRHHHQGSLSSGLCPIEAAALHDQTI